MNNLFSQKFRIVVGFAALLLGSFGYSNLYTQSKTKQLAQQYPEKVNFALASNQAVNVLATSFPNSQYIFFARQISNETIESKKNQKTPPSRA